MAEGTRTCFVIQGFGKKTDYRTGRVLDLDASYDVIKEAVQAAGFECVRADEIQHSGNIDLPMYEQILNADLVIADLSTSNVNAAYELGVRHGLRRKTTIIVAEEQFSFPFDVNHIAIRTYEHLGTDIGRREAQRFRKELTEAIEAIMQGEKTDSPVYVFLPSLRPPSAGAEPDADAPAPPVEGSDEAPAESVKVMMDQARASVVSSDFVTARALWTGLSGLLPKDHYVKQQLALATYKAEEPTKIDALFAAQAILESLRPDRSHDAETLGLWGAVHKGLWEETGDRAHLNTAIGAYERGFVLQRDYYNGINVAFLLNVRASLSEPAEAVTDFVIADRVRNQVVPLAEAALPSAREAPPEKHAEYWVLATLREAAHVRGDEELAQEYAEKAAAKEPPQWALDSTEAQIAKLDELLADSPLKHLRDVGE